MHDSLTGKLAIFLFVPICISLFNKKRIDEATALSILGACLFLPEHCGFDPPLIPPLDKHSISTFLVLIMLSTKPKEDQPGSKTLQLAGTLLILAAIGTVLTNRDPLMLGPGIFQPGLSFGDVTSTVWWALAKFIVPFMIGKRVFNNKESLMTLFNVMAHFGVIYAFLMLVEIRMSPQLNNWIYGYMQHDFLQTIRNGSYRPMVFMSHGLVTAMYCLMSIYAAIALHKAQQKIFGIKAMLWAAFLIGVLMLSNSMGAAIFCVFGVLLLFVAKPQTIARILTVMIIIAFAFPFLRTSGTIPVEDIVAFFVGIDPDRAASLEYRINMEQLVIKKWELRPAFGYAGYGRAHMFDEYGKDMIVMDSQWIIAFANRGIFGYVGQFLLYVVPVMAIRKHLVRMDDPELRPVLTSLALMVTITTFDLLVNSSSNAILPMLSGALIGLAGKLNQSSGAAPAPAPVPQTA